MYARGVTQMKKSHKKNKNQEIIVDKKTVHFREYTVKELLELGERTKDRKSTRLNSSHANESRMPSSA